MEYRRLGRTRERVSVIGMGAWGMGLLKNSEAWTRELRSLRRGMELGVTLIDTAEIYSSGRSEELVGEAVKGHREEVLLATKVAPPHLDHDAVIKACNKSLRRLGTTYIDLYQVHWPDPSVSIKETMSAMEKLVQEGKVRYIGVSNFGVAETTDARAALGRNEITSNQVEYSLTNRYVEPEILPYCSREGITLIAYSPLAHGRITTSVQESLLGRYKMTPAQIMLNWVTRNECVVAIPKASDVAHMEENAASVSARFDPKDYELLSSSL
jgi:diketogulonate reductase-like aldo/keto reductase